MVYSYYSPVEINSQFAQLTILHIRWISKKGNFYVSFIRIKILPKWKQITSGFLNKLNKRFPFSTVLLYVFDIYCKKMVKENFEYSLYFLNNSKFEIPQSPYSCKLNIIWISLHLQSMHINWVQLLSHKKYLLQFVFLSNKVRSFFIFILKNRQPPIGLLSRVVVPFVVILGAWEEIYILWPSEIKIEKE